MLLSIDFHTPFYISDGGNTGNIVATFELNSEANGNESYTFTLIEDPWPGKHLFNLFELNHIKTTYTVFYKRDKFHRSYEGLT